MTKPKTTRLSPRLRKRLALTRKEDRDHKADLIARGLCRQCGKTRGTSPSTSRCIRCLRKSRAARRQSGHHRPHHAGMPGRPLLQVSRKMDEASSNPLSLWADRPGVGPVDTPVEPVESAPVPVILPTPASEKE